MKFTLKEQLFLTVLLIVILLLWFTQIEFIRSADFAASIIPGWHTTLIPLRSLLLWLLILVLLIFTAVKVIRFVIRKNDS
jgi:hypothetical protein